MCDFEFPPCQSGAFMQLFHCFCKQFLEFDSFHFPHSLSLARDEKRHVLCAWCFVSGSHFTAAFTHVPNLTGSLAAVDSSVVRAARQTSTAQQLKGSSHKELTVLLSGSTSGSKTSFKEDLRTSLKRDQLRVRWTKKTFEIMFADIAWSHDLKQPTISPSINLPIFQQHIHSFTNHPFIFSANIEPSKNQPPSLHPRTHLAILNQSPPILDLCACNSFPLSAVK